MKTAPAEDFTDFAAGWTDGRPQVVVRRVIDDLESPVSAYLKVGAGRPYAFLLESVEGGELKGRYSILTLDPDLVWRLDGDRASIARDAGVAADAFTPVDGDAIESLRDIIAASRFTPPPGLPPMIGGLFGVFGYDTVRRLEPLGPGRPDELNLPDAILTRPSLVAVFDSVRHEIIVAALAYPRPDQTADAAWAAANERIDAFVWAVRQPRLMDAPVVSGAEEPRFVSAMGQEAYEGIVDAAKDYIRAGDIFQVVLSHRMSADFSGDPFSVYRALRRQNPSPYLYYLNLGGFQLAGSSPEILVRLKDGKVTIRPLAGTRARGATPEADRALEAELLADPKERAEHLMLLDLGRNDVGRVSKPGTVTVTDSFAIERYSHVMHIVSNVQGQADPSIDAVDALLAALPAGTLSGAPKVRAMEIIDELEISRRGPGYGGGVGYISPTGEADICIVLRTALFTPGKIHVQAGAGVVADSDPSAEFRETEMKAQAVIRAAQDAWRF